VLRGHLTMSLFSSSKKRAGEWVKKGIALDELGRYEEAIECHDRALEIDSEDAAAWYNKGIALMKLGRYEEAIECFDEVLKIDPEYAYAWNNKGFSLMKLGRYEEAIECFDEVLKIYPEDAYAWYNKGIALFELGRHEEAIECFDRALKIDPEYAAAWNNKGIALMELGRHEEAIECYDRALKIDPEYAAAWNNKGIALMELGRYEEAICCFDEALKIDPNNIDTQHNRSLALNKLGSHELPTTTGKDGQKSEASAEDSSEEMGRGVDTVAPDTNTLRFTGADDQATELFYLEMGLYLFSLEGNGYSLEVLSEAGDTVEFIAFDGNGGSKAVQIKKSGYYLLNIGADGKWTAEIRRPRIISGPRRHGPQDNKVGVQKGCEHGTASNIGKCRHANKGSGIVDAPSEKPFQRRVVLSDDPIVIDALEDGSWGEEKKSTESPDRYLDDYYDEKDEEYYKRLYEEINALQLFNIEDEEFANGDYGDEEYYKKLYEEINQLFNNDEEFIHDYCDDYEELHEEIKPLKLFNIEDEEFIYDDLSLYEDTPLFLRDEDLTHDDIEDDDRLDDVYDYGDYYEL